MLQGYHEQPADSSPGHVSPDSVAHKSVGLDTERQIASNSVKPGKLESSNRKSRVALACKRCKRRKQRVCLKHVPPNLKGQTIADPDGRSAMGAGPSVSPVKELGWTARTKEQCDHSIQEASRCELTRAQDVQEW
jgi:hypothetical protein